MEASRSHSTEFPYFLAPTPFSTSALKKIATDGVFAPEKIAIENG